MVLACAAAISMTPFLVPFLLYLSPPTLSCLCVCMFATPPHPHTFPGKYILSPTLHCQHGNLWPFTPLCCCSSVLVSLFFLFSVFSLTPCFSFFSLLSLSLSFVWLVMSGLSNYVSIFSVVLIVFFSFVSF